MRLSKDAKERLRMIYANHFDGEAFGDALGSACGDVLASTCEDALASTRGSVWRSACESACENACESACESACEEQPQAVFASAPGRIELAGNHTDHQGGSTISAAIDLRIYALAVPTQSDEIHVYMDGFGTVSLELSSLEMREDEKGSSASLIRGMAAAYVRSGKKLRGFNMVTCSNIPVGCGLSSSAAFEMLVGVVLRALCSPAEQITPDDLISLALEGVWAERTYFGKLCGAQDQLASAVGGVLSLDFASDTPRVEPISFDINAYPYTIFLIDSRSDHSFCIDEYSSVPADMFAVAQYFGCAVLSDVSSAMFLEQLHAVRAQLGDRAALRALHYFEEARRVQIQKQALKNSNLEAFLRQMRFSGASSAQFLQNVSPFYDGTGTSQPVMVILALCAHFLDGNGLNDDGRRGAYRVHGGGFGGSVLAFVPEREADAFKTGIETILGYDVCLNVGIDSCGVRVEGQY